MSDNDSAISWDRQGGVTVVRFNEDHPDEEVFSTQAPAEFGKLLDILGGGDVLVDLSNVIHVSSSGVTAFITLKQLVEAKGGLLKLAGLQPEVKRMFRMARLDTVFDLHETASEAMTEFRFDRDGENPGGATPSKK